MKDILHRIKQYGWKKSRTRMIAAVLALVVVSGGLAVYAFVTRSTVVQAEMMDMNSDELLDTRIGVVGEDSATSTGNVDPGNSWPAELVSSDLAQVQPQREGTIVNWRVGVGQYVSAGDVLGKVSAPLATPELTKMLAEQRQAAAEARAQARVADDFTTKETARLTALRDSIGSTSGGSSADLTFNALQTLRDQTAVKKQALRSFVERALAGHVATVTNFTDWRNVRYGGLGRYGTLNQSVRNNYETALVGLVSELKTSDSVSIDNATKYFDLATRLGNNTVSDMPTDFKTMAAADQKEFLDMVADYREAQSMVADKETEYKLMINEKTAMLSKDQAMAHASADAAETAYSTVANEITGSAYIYAPRSGTISAIYKKVGDLVGPDMAIASITGTRGEMVVRMHIPSNTRRPTVGEIVSVVRPGFPHNVHKARITGVGSSLDVVGSYMADAVLIDQVDWPAGGSVRVLAPDDARMITVPLTALWWDADGIPHVWGVSPSPVNRLFAIRVKVGRTLGTSVEIYEGLKKDDRYVMHPTPDMHEDQILEEKLPAPKAEGASESGGHGGHESMPGMDM